MPISYLIIVLLVIASYASFKTGKLTAGAAVIGGIVGLSIYLGTGYIGMVMLAIFFILSTFATSHRKEEKRNLTIDEHPQQRNTRQVLANGGLAAILGLLALAFPDKRLLATVFMAAAFSSAMADTLSSELGTVYGKRFYNILNFTPGKRGEDGVISTEGLLIGIIGSGLIAFTYSLKFGWNATFINIIVAGTLGNLTDSVLGATLERRGFLNNNEVNFLNTFTAVIISCLLLLL